MAKSKATDKPAKGKAVVAAPAYNLAGMEKALSAGLGRAVTIKKLVTVPVIRQKEGDTCLIKITSEMRIGKAIKQTGADGKEVSREPATVVDCVNLATQQPAVYICSAVVKGNLNDAYPDNSYVGKCFAIFKGAKGENKAYRDMQVVEINDPDAE